MTYTNPVLSFEFFPPKTADGIATLATTSATLAELKPGFFSVTFGAGGSTRDHTFETVAELQKNTGVDTAPHLSCIGSTRENIREALSAYREKGISHMVALRGDMPSGMVGAGELRYANELVSFIREETGDHFHLEVAAYPEYHPQANSPDKDFANFAHKVEAGANSAITQYFYNLDAYLRFTDRCAGAGIDIPIVPGIMDGVAPAEGHAIMDACGADLPRWLRPRLAAYGAALASLRAFGEDVVTSLCARLLEEGTPGLHFYTLNRAAPAVAICNNLSLPSS